MNRKVVFAFRSEQVSGQWASAMQQKHLYMIARMQDNDTVWMS